MYFAHNRLRTLFGCDREAMTTDGSGGSYIGRIASCKGTRLRLGKPIPVPSTSIGQARPGMAVYVLGGRGAGQLRTVVEQEDQVVEVDRPWAVAPDGTSIVSITMLQQNYLIVGNDFSDATIAAQFFGISISHIVADNVCARSGGYQALGLNYSGIQPSWFCQFLDNTIAEGNGILGPLNEESPLDSQVMAHGTVIPQIGAPLCRGVVMRRNHLHSIARLALLAALKDAIVEQNTVENADVGMWVDGKVEGALARDNRFVNVRQPYAGPGIGKAVVHPAEAMPGRSDAAVQTAPARSSGDRATSDSMDAIVEAVLDKNSDAALKTLTAYVKDSNTEIKEAAIRALCGWPSGAPAKVLSSVAADTSATSEQRTIALEGFINLIPKQAELSDAQLIADFEKAIAWATRLQEKRLVLSKLAGFRYQGALELAQQLATERALKNDAELTVKKIRELLAKPGSTASHNAAEVQKAFDGDPRTRWTIGIGMRGGEWFQMELDPDQVIAGVVLDCQGSDGGYARGYEVYVSNNSFVEGGLVAKGEGASEVIEIPFDRPVSGHTLKVIQTGMGGGNWWSVHELKLQTK